MPTNLSNFNSNGDSRKLDHKSKRYSDKIQSKENSVTRVADAAPVVQSATTAATETTTRSINKVKSVAIQSG